jgi:hypothetical protein
MGCLPPHGADCVYENVKDLVAGDSEHLRRRRADRVAFDFSI